MLKLFDITLAFFLHLASITITFFKPLFAFLFLIFVFHTSKIIFSLYIIMSIKTFFDFNEDKEAAINGKSRIPEKKLHSSEFWCGWPGAFLGQYLFNHKTKKQKYKDELYMNVFFNVSIFFLMYYFFL